MPEFKYKARDKDGRLRTGQRTASSIDNLSNELIKEGIYPIQIFPLGQNISLMERIQTLIGGDIVKLPELAIFARQMQLLHQANVPIITSLKQLAAHTRSRRFKGILYGVIEHIEKGQSLGTAMKFYPQVFSPLMISIVQIGENTGRLSESFSHLHEYLEFESSSIKQIKSAFRYPIFVVVSILFSIIILNVFVIPTFSKFYLNMTTGLPWETMVLITLSNLTIHYGIYILILLVIATFMFVRYIRTPEGKYRWHHFMLRIPLFGKLLRRVTLIRFCQSFAIILSSGISVTQGLNLIRQVMQNAYIKEQISQAKEAIERGVAFTQAIVKVELFTPLELQILAVGEKNGELSPALNYIGNFHRQEIEFDLKKINDFIGPVLISVISGLILIMALGVYLPVWNMINLVH